MKTVLNLCTLMVLAMAINAQTVRVENDKVVVTGTNTMGIGVDIPQATLDVNGGIKIGDETTSHPGLLRFRTGEFEGFDGSVWKSLSEEEDGSTSNELISTIQLTDNFLQITEGGIIKSADLSSFDGPFERNGNVIRQKDNFSTDDFIIGRDDLPQPGQTYSDNLFFFSKEKGAFRSGRIQNSQNWVLDSLGFRSAAFGFNSIAKGSNAFAIGQSSKANGADTFCGGTGSRADAQGGMSFGESTVAFAEYCAALGSHTIAPSFVEVALGYYNTDYTADRINTWDNDDRLFVIGNGNSSFRSDALVLWKNGKMGLGESNPEARFHINATNNEDALEVYVGANREFFISDGGQVGVGNIINPDAKLWVESIGSEDIFRVRSNELTKFKINENGGIRNNNSPATFAIQLQNSSTELLGKAQAFSWDTYSDMRIKSNVAPIEYGLEQLMQLEPKGYDHHDSEYFEDGRVVLKGKKTSKDIGFLAQEVFEVIPEAVSRPDSEEEQLWSMDYTRLIPVLVKSIQQQQEMIEALTETIQAQQAQIDALKNK
ncbi:MAG: tail fiber domain-containing protein [Bacteroidota bacterium]